jgi:hypothetical protein
MFYTCCWNTILSNVWLIIFILLLLIQTQQYHSFATPKFYHYYLINSNPLLGISQLNPTLLIITHSAKRGSLLALKLLVSFAATPGSTSWGFRSQEEERDCCCSRRRMGSHRIPSTGLDGWQDEWKKFHDHDVLYYM